MATLIKVFAALGALAIIFMASLGIATRIVYGFDIGAIVGWRKQAKRKSVLYVSRAWRNPTAVYWLGSEGWQEDKVAQGIVSGDLPQKDYSETVNKELNWTAIRSNVATWPSAEAKDLYGSPADVAPE